MAKKVFSTLVIILLAFIFFSTCIPVQASSIGGIINGAGSFINDGGASGDQVIRSDALKSTSDLIYNILLILGVCIAVIIAAILGIQFITGSVEQKVKVKESLIPFVVGCIVIFGAFGIWRLVVVLLSEATKA